jgi:hypothetical protein
MDLAGHLPGGGAGAPQENGQLAFQRRELLVHTISRRLGFDTRSAAVSVLLHVSTPDPVSRS